MCGFLLESTPVQLLSNYLQGIYNWILITVMLKNVDHYTREERVQYTGTVRWHNANVTVSLTLVSNKLNIPIFLYVFPMGLKWNCWKCLFEETVPNLSVNFGKHDSQDSHNNNIMPLSSISVLWNHNTAANVDQICCQSALSLPLENSQRRTAQSREHNQPIHALVGLLGTSYLVSVS